MRKRRILPVDDDRAFTKLVKMNLEATGNYEVREDNLSATALSVAREFHPDLILPGIVMPGIVMPGMDGGDVRAMLEGDPGLKDVPTVFLTALVNKSEVHRHRGHFADGDFLAKPVSVEELMDCIETHLAA